MPVPLTQPASSVGAAQALALQGLPEMNLKNVNIENSILKAKKGITAVDADGVLLKNVRVIAETGPALTIYNSRNIAVEGLGYSETRGPVVRVLGPLTENIRLESKDFKNASQQVARGEDLNAAALTMEKK